MKNGSSEDFGVDNRYMWLIKLKPIEKEDLDKIQAWRNSDDVMPYCRQYRPLTQQDMLNWYESLGNESDYHLTNDLFLIEYKGEDIGVGGFVRIDWRNRKAELSFYVGTSSKVDEDIVSMAISALLEYAFKTLNLHKVSFPVYEFNPYLPIYKKVLEEEYIAKKEYYWEGKYHDRIILVKYNEYIQDNNQI